MASVRIQIKEGRVKFWRTQNVGKGKERVVRGTVGEIEKGQKFPETHPAFQKGGRPIEE